jgi:two-component system sensor histidine kinase/response regulator
MSRDSQRGRGPPGTPPERSIDITALKQAEAGTLRANQLLDPLAALSACDDNEEALRLLCRGFREYLPRRMDELTHAACAADAHRIREAAHRLSSLLYAFSTTAGDVASRLEDLAAEGDLVSCAALVLRLEAMSTQLLSQTADLTLEGLHLRRGWSD